jgi:3'(2'), 5'-bisphosphate nucleotidase
MSRSQLRQYLAPTLVAASRAGEAILQFYQSDFDVSYKDDDTPLTLADESAHRAVWDHLTTEAPGHFPILSEEGKQTPYEERKRWDYFWLVDPLDGTKEFIKGRDEFSVNIALIRKNRPVLGVVFLPALGSLYFAAEGIGSYKLEDLEAVEQLIGEQGQPQHDEVLLDALLEAAIRLPIHQPPKSSRDKVVLVGSRSHATTALTDFVHNVEQRYEKVEFTPAGSALKFCLVAEGRADIYPRLSPTMEWDTAAGHCVVEQSGGKVIRVAERKSLDYNKRDLRNPHFICMGKYSGDIQLEFI